MVQSVCADYLTASGLRLSRKRTAVSQSSDKGLAVPKASAEACRLFALTAEQNCSTLSPPCAHRFCKYPQEFVLRLERSSKIQQIQILAHEYKVRDSEGSSCWCSHTHSWNAKRRVTCDVSILLWTMCSATLAAFILAGIHLLCNFLPQIPTKIEVFVSPEGAAPDAADAAASSMRRLGYLSFDSNERSNHQARELKSVHVSVEAQLVRLLIHRCHVNKLNIYNQVRVALV